MEEKMGNTKSVRKIISPGNSAIKTGAYFLVVILFPKQQPHVAI